MAQSCRSEVKTARWGMSRDFVDGFWSEADVDRFFVGLLATRRAVRFTSMWTMGPQLRLFRGSFAMQKTQSLVLTLADERFTGFQLSHPTVHLITVIGPVNEPRTASQPTIALILSVDTRLLQQRRGGRQAKSHNSLHPSGLTFCFEAELFPTYYA